MNAIKLALLVNAFLYAGLGTGLMLLCDSSISRLVKRAMMHRRLRPKRKQSGRLMSWASSLVEMSLGKEDKGAVFITVSLLIMGAMFIAAVRVISFWGSILMALTAALIPAAVLRLILENRRRQGSREGEGFVSEMISRYHISGHSIDRTLELIVARESSGVCRTLAATALSRMRLSRTKGELRRSGEVFSKVLGTSWAAALSYLIGAAASEGIDITAGLEDLLMQLQEARAATEERKRLNSEAGRIVLIMVPLAYVVTTFFTVRYLDVPLRTLMHNQFCTPEGVVLSFAITVTLIINLSLLAYVEHERFDY